MKFKYCLLTIPFMAIFKKIIVYSLYSLIASRKSSSITFDALAPFFSQILRNLSYISLSRYRLIGCLLVSLALSKTERFFFIPYFYRFFKSKDILFIAGNFTIRSYLIYIIYFFLFIVSLTGCQKNNDVSYLLDFETVCEYSHTETVYFQDASEKKSEIYYCQESATRECQIAVWVNNSDVFETDCNKNHLENDNVE